MRLKNWPGSAYPIEEHEIRQAVGSLFQHAGWATEKLTPREAEAVQDELRKWFEAKYSVNAILVALDRLPNNELQPPRRSGESLADYIRSRMQAWFDDDNDDSPLADAIRRPPRPGMSFAQWWVVNQRMRERSATGTAPGLSERGRRARQDAFERSRAPRRDPIARARAKDRSIAAAMDSLLLPGVQPPTFEDAQTFLPPTERSTGRMVATYAGKRAVIANDLQVVRIVERLIHERRPPRPTEMAVLRNAIKNARVTAAMGALEAAEAEVNPDVGVLSETAWKMLSYLDHAMAADLPLDSMTVLLDMAVNDD